MGNLEIVNLSVVKTDLAHRVQRLTNYADAACEQPSARKVLNTVADAEMYDNLLTDACLRAFQQLGRLCNGVEQPPETETDWPVAIKLVPDVCNSLLVKQLGNALLQVLATDVAAHWLMLQNSERAAVVLQSWQNAQAELRNLTLWCVKPPRIKQHEF